MIRTVILTISDKCMDVYEFNKDLKIARPNDFIFIQLNKLTIKLFVIYQLKKYIII